MGPLRCLIDSMIFDAIAGEPHVVALVDRLTNARRVELLASPVSLEQVAATPDEGHRRRLQRVRVLVVPPVEPGEGPAGPVLGALLRSPGVDEGDAQVAASALVQGVPLVTEDRSLRQAAATLLPELPRWTWGDDLRPRIIALADAPTFPPRRRRAGVGPHRR